MIIMKKGDLPKGLVKVESDFRELTKGYAGFSDGIPHLSSTSLDSMEECSLAFKFRREHKTFSIYLLLGVILHAILEDAARAFAFSEVNSKNVALFDKYKEEIIMSKMIDAFAQLDDGTMTINMDKLAPKLHEEILDRDLMVNVIKHVAAAFTLEKSLEIAVDNKEVAMVEAEVRGVIGKGSKIPWLGYVDSIKWEESTRTIFIDDYKTGWSPRSVNNWKTAVTPTRQFYIYRKLVEENIKELYPTVEHVVPRLMLITLTGFPLAKAMDKRNKGVTFKTLLKGTPIVEVYTKALSNTLNDAMYDNSIRLAELMLTHGVENTAASKFGCGFCDHANICPYNTAMNRLAEENIDE